MLDPQRELPPSSVFAIGLTEWTDKRTRQQTEGNVLTLISVLLPLLEQVELARVKGQLSSYTVGGLVVAFPL